MLKDYGNCVFTGRNEVVAKVIFLHLSVILFTGGRCLSQCMLGYHPPRAHTPTEQTPPRADTAPQSRHPAKTRHPPPGPHPRGKLRGIRSRPTPKGEIEGDQIQAHTLGGN